MLHFCTYVSVRVQSVSTPCTCTSAYNPTTIVQIALYLSPVRPNRFYLCRLSAARPISPSPHISQNAQSQHLRYFICLSTQARCSSLTHPRAHTEPSYTLTHTPFINFAYPPLPARYFYLLLFPAPPPRFFQHAALFPCFHSLPLSFSAFFPASSAPFPILPST